MSTKIRLKRFGKKRTPSYRIVVIDSRKARNGQAIEEIGLYDPTRQPSIIEVNSDRVQYWLSVGAQPSEQMRKLLELTGDWGKFKGDKNAKSTVKPQPAKLSADEKIKAALDAAEQLKATKAKELQEAAKAAEEAAKAEAEAKAAELIAEAAEENATEAVEEAVDAAAEAEVKEIVAEAAEVVAEEAAADAGAPEEGEAK